MFKSHPIIDQKVFDPTADIGINTRCYYTPTTANEYKPIFDELLTNRENRQILCSDAGLKSTTLYQKCQDALKWLAENGDSKYALLRKEISMRRKSDRILLFFKASVRHIVSKGGMVGGTMELEEQVRGWKDDVTDWLGSAVSGSIYDSRTKYGGLVLNQEEREWLVKMLGGLEGCELDLTADYFRIAR